MTDIFIAPKKTPDVTIENKVFRRSTPSLENKIKARKIPTKETPSILRAESTKNSDPYAFKKRMSPFSAFGIRPYGVSFGEQAEDEEIFLFLRRHIVTNVPWLLAGFILILLPPFLSLASNYYLFPVIIPPNFLFVLILFYYLVVITFLFTEYINWFFNISLVTDSRVVDLNYSDIIYHDMAVTKLELIEDIDYVQAGFIRSFFDYGNVFIQTAGTKVIFHFDAIPKPAKATEIVQNLMGGDKDVWG